MAAESLAAARKCRYPHTDLGQFVIRYYAETLRDAELLDRGLCLDGGIPDWTVTGANMRQVFEELLR